MTTADQSEQVTSLEPIAGSGDELREDLTSASGTARDLVTVGAWTALSRGTGVIRVVVIGAVLGPTFLGNTYQLTNSLPNLIYYGFLAGSLFVSLLVPALVQHIDNHRPKDSARVAGGFLGIALVLLGLLAPIAVLLLPELLRVTSLGGVGLSEVTRDSGQIGVTRLLILLTIPQVFLYAVVGSATAVMYAHRRFALAAAAPLVENLGIILVLVLVGMIYGTGRELGAQSTGEVLLLGLGSTGAVAAHAAIQWWGARRAGVLLRPRAGWRDPEVLVTIRKALRSVTQAGLLAVQLLALLLVSNRVAGGTVAIQMALNFYYLPIALAATPVALALLPRLSRLHQSDSTGEFTSTFIEGLGLALFMAIPAAVGFVVLADPIAHTIAAGQMASPEGLRMIALGLAALALGLVGETTFYVTTQASYARGDTRTPLVSMGVQAAFCLTLCAVAAFAPARLLVPAIGGAYAIGAVIGGAHLFLRMSRGWQRRELWGSLGRIAFGSIVMAIPAYFSAQLISSHLGGRPGQALALVTGAAVGVIVYAVIQLLLRSPEFAWLTSGLRNRGKTTVVETG
ncbi:murein biosynthesis integral membrane protein MurJ [Kribbella sp. NPDC051620]|uniref:murein biosynthesis integral membrane protein MurJ n=1 Tax=Kribbella sp. NPDC051620 TaxID=3364120 RepID=UPI0037B90158